MQDKILEIVFDKDDVTWQQIIYDLVKNEEMDPWDVNVTLIAERFIKMVRQLQEMDFRISGKVILAAAILLKIKAVRLVEDDVSDFDKLILATEEMSEEQFYGDLEAEQLMQQETKPGEEFMLIPRTPQPRKRKVSVYDLVAALQKALEVKHRRIMREIPEIKVHLPEYHVDIDVIISKLYERIETYLKSKEGNKLTFSQLVPSNERLDKVMTFVPLLHLSGQRKIDMLQEQHFGEIEISLAVPKPVDINLENESNEEEENHKSEKTKNKEEISGEDEDKKIKPKRTYKPRKPKTSIQQESQRAAETNNSSNGSNISVQNETKPENKEQQDINKEDTNPKVNDSDNSNVEN